MRRLVLLGLTAALMLAGCSRDTQGASGEARGRYGGIGLYPAGQMWAQLAHPAPGNPAAARLDDDEQIIVVIDSRTGEVRQCGNVSGYCVALNPWGGALAVGQRAPLPLAKHADQLEREAAAAAKPSPSR